VATVFCVLTTRNFTLRSQTLDSKCFDSYIYQTTQ